MNIHAEIVIRSLMAHCFQCFNILKHRMTTSPHTHMARRLMKKIGIFYANLTIWRYLFYKSKSQFMYIPIGGNQLYCALRQQHVLWRLLRASRQEPKNGGSWSTLHYVAVVLFWERDYSLVVRSHYFYIVCNTYYSHQYYFYLTNYNSFSHSHGLLVLMFHGMLGDLTGASLSEPHINGFALHEMYVCLYIYMVRLSHSVYMLF